MIDYRRTWPELSFIFIYLLFFGIIDDSVKNPYPWLILFNLLLIIITFLYDLKQKYKYE